MTLAQPNSASEAGHLMVLVTALLTSLAALVSSLVNSLAPAFYSTSWIPWVRYALGGCVVVVLIIMVKATGVWLGMPT